MVYRTKPKTVRKEMIGKRDKFWGGSEKQSALELRWFLVTDCSRGGFQPLETHNHQQWTAVYVGSLAAGWLTDRLNALLHPQTTRLHPALPGAAASIFLQLYLKPAVHFLLQIPVLRCSWISYRPLHLRGVHCSGKSRYVMRGTEFHGENWLTHLDTFVCLFADW